MNSMNKFYYPTNQGNFQTAFKASQPVPVFGYDPKGIFDNYNFKNKNDILHNNLKKIILNEEIREYSVMIDSKDRNYQVYPDPFTYDVKFNPLPTKKEKMNGKNVIYEESAPIINDSLSNVRYIKLETIILPLYTEIKLVDEVNEDDEIIKTWKVDTTKLLSDNLYNVLSIGEFNDINYRSTNDVLSDSFATIYYDKKISNTHFLGCSKNGIKIFPQDQLAKIDKLKITFMNPYGKSICCKHVDKRIMSNLECTCDETTDDENNDCFEHNLFHPLNPIFQHHLHFKIGVLESRLNKNHFN